MLKNGMFSKIMSKAKPNHFTKKKIDKICNKNLAISKQRDIHLVS